MLDNIFRVFMFMLPFAICVAAYVWVGKKAVQTTNRVTKTAALVIIGGGLAYTLYRLVRTAGTAFTNDNFEYLIIIVAVAVLALASIVMAVGEPEEEGRSRQ